MNNFISIRSILRLIYLEIHDKECNLRLLVALIFITCSLKLTNLLSIEALKGDFAELDFMLNFKCLLLCQNKRT